MRLLPDHIPLALTRADMLEALGRPDDAIKSYMDMLQRHPQEWAALERLAILLAETGRTSAARRLFDEQLRRRPTDAWTHTRLAHLLQEAGEIEAARAAYGAALRHDPHLPAAHEGLAVLLSDLGEESEAAAHRRAAFEGGPVRILPYRGAEPPLRVLVLASARGGNIRYRSLLQHGPFALTVLAADFFDPSAPLPPHDVVLNAIGDSDRAGPALECARTLVGRTRARVVNAPEAIVGRAAVADLARRIDGMRAPRMLDVVRHRVLDGQVKVMQEELSRAGITPPFLLRTPGFHTGRHFVRVESLEEFPAAVGRIPGAVLSAIEFLDTRGPDGLYRKFRVMAVGGRLLPGHMAASDDWMVHYATSLTPTRPDLQAEERAFLTHMEAVLPRRGLAALRRMAAALHLDYAGLDFGVGACGEIVLFEANPAMLLLDPPEAAVYAGELRSARRVVREAFQQVLIGAAAGRSMTSP